MSAPRWAALIERHYRAVLVASLLLGAAAALSLTRLRLDVDVLGMLPRGEPAFDDFKTFVADFGELDELLILVDGPRPAREQVAAALTAALARVDGIASVQGRIDTATAAEALLGRYLANYIPLADHDELRQRLTPDGIAAQLAADKALLAAPFDLSLARAVSEDPLGLRRIAGRHLAAAAGDALPDLAGGYLTARDGEALLLIARPTGSAFDGAFTARLLSGVDRAIATARAAVPDAPVRVALTGSYVFAQEDAATLKADIQRYTLLSLLGVLAVFWFGYGNLRVLPFVAYPLLLSTLLAFAVSLLLYDQLNALSLSFAAILYGLSIDSAIHFYGRLLEARQRHPGEARAAIAETLASLGWANVAGSGTTAAAFLVIALSCLAVVQQLGILTTIGMLITLGEFFVLYPALGFLLLRHGAALPPARDTPRLGAWAAAAQRRAALVRGILVLVAIGGVLGALRVPLDPSLRRLRPTDSPALRVQEEIAARFTRSDRAGAVLVAGADTEAALVAGEAVAARLRAYRDEGVLANPQTIDALLPSAAVQRRRLAAYDALPRDAALAALDPALRAAGFDPARFAGFKAAFAAPRDEIVTLATPALAPFAPVIERHVREHAGGAAMVASYAEPAAGHDWSAIATRLRADLPDLPLAVAARSLLEERLRGVLERELLAFIALAVVANFALLALALGDLRDAAAVLAPVLLVVVAVFALMAAGGMAVDPVNLVVTPLLLGIGVDNGVYVLNASRELGGAGPAVRSCGRAICVTSGTTIAGFGVLALSTYPPLAALGSLMVVGLALALAAAIVALPALMRRTG
ncbi:MMPL family transporter [bacterium]|nr:MMPL family transporter [bacterium]